MRIAFLSAALAVLALPSGAAARADRYDATAALAYSQAAIGRPVRDIALRDTSGKRLALSDLRGRPVVISMIYTSCADTCPTTTGQLARLVDVAREALGATSFTVLTVGFDSLRDTPVRMRDFARLYGTAGPDWRFVSADAAAIEKLASDLGFLYFRSPKGFDHLAQTTILDGRGRVFSQVYGALFDTPAFVEPLKALVFGEKANFTSFSGLVNRLRLFCTIYNPANERYRFDYSIFIGGIIGLVSLLGVAVVLVRGWRRQGRAA
jgi:protein SCO1